MPVENNRPAGAAGGPTGAGRRRDPIQLARGLIDTLARRSGFGSGATTGAVVGAGLLAVTTFNPLGVLAGGAFGLLSGAFWGPIVGWGARAVDSLLRHFSGPPADGNRAHPATAATEDRFYDARVDDGPNVQRRPDIEVRVLPPRPPLRLTNGAIPLPPSSASGDSGS